MPRLVVCDVCRQESLLAACRIGLKKEGVERMQASPAPFAFLSYAHADNRHDDDRIVQLSVLLSAEVRVQTGDEFPIFVDKAHIQWGQNWQQRISQSLDTVTFLIPVLTPSYFKSQACRQELEQFLARERRLQRTDLILPVYYVHYSPLHESEQQASDPLLRAIASRQWADWRPLRFESLKSLPVLRALEQLALQVRAALVRVETP